MTKTVDDRCPICRKPSQILHTSVMVRDLGMRLGWDRLRQPLAVCVDCYAVLDAHKLVLERQAKKERA